jgi:hypothetical protein
MAYYTAVPFEILVGTTFLKVSTTDESVIFENDCQRFELHHDQDCCERVTLHDTNGDVKDLLDHPILFAVESSSSEPPAPANCYRAYDDGGYVSSPDSYTWTFYRIGTVKGTVVFRFYGESNGYYSESVTLHDCSNKD